MNRSHAALGLLLALMGGAVLWSLSGSAIQDVLDPKAPPTAEPERLTPPDPGPLRVEPRRQLASIPQWLVDLLRGNADEEEEEEEDGRPRHTCGFKGTVIVKDKPWIKVRGMRVRLTRMWLDTIIPSQLSLPEEYFLDNETVTDKHGRFVLERVPLRHMLFLVLQRGKTIYEVHKIDEFPDAGQSRELGDVIFDPRGSVHARIVDGDGNPISGVDVRAVDDKHNKGPGRDETLHQRRILGVARFDATRRSRGKTYSNFVRRRDRFLPFPRVETDENGEFTLHGVREGEVTLFLNAKQGHGIEDRVLVAAHETTELGDLILERGEELRIRLVHPPKKTREIKDENLVPIPRAWVSVQPKSWSVSVPPVVTDEGGYCTVRVPPGSYAIHVRCPGRRVWETPFSIGRSKRVHRYAVRPAVTCRVLLEDEAGSLVPGATVVLYAYGQRHGAMARIGRLGPKRRGPAGKFEFEGIAARTRVLVVGTAPGFAPAVEGGVASEGFTLRMQPGARVRILTVDRGGRPVAGARVTAKFMDSQLPPQLRIRGESWQFLTQLQPALLGWTNESGFLDVDGLGRGRAHFAATLRTYTQSPTPEFHVRDDTQVTIRMEKSARLDGRLLLDDLPPTRPYQIHARPRADISHTSSPNPMLASHTTMTGKDGTFYFNDLYRGPWVLSISAPGIPTGSGFLRVWPEGEQEVVHVVADLRVFHTIRLERKDHAFGIRGRVRLQGRPNFAELFVVAKRVNEPDMSAFFGRKPKGTSSQRWNTRVQQLKATSWYRLFLKRQTRMSPSRIVARCRVSAPGGKYSLKLQRSGTYEIGLRMAQGGRVQSLASRRVEVGAKSEPKIKTLDLTLASGDLELIVARLGGVRVGRRILSLHQTGPGQGAVFRIRTDADGVARLDGIPAGRYEVRSERTRDGIREFRSIPSFVVDPGTRSKRYVTANW